MFIFWKYNFLPLKLLILLILCYGLKLCVCVCVCCSIDCACEIIGYVVELFEITSSGVYQSQIEKAKRYTRGKPLKIEIFPYFS